MSLLRLAVNTSRWDLAAHTLLAAGIMTMKKGVKPDDRDDEKTKNSSKKDR